MLPRLFRSSQATFACLTDIEVPKTSRMFPKVQTIKLANGASPVSPKFQYSKKCKTYIYFGRITEGKGIRLVLEAWAKFKSENTISGSNFVLWTNRWRRGSTPTSTEQSKISTLAIAVI